MPEHVVGSLPQPRAEGGERPGASLAIANVCTGSKCEELSVSKSSPLCPNERTSMRRAAAFLKGEGGLRLFEGHPVRPCTVASRFAPNGGSCRRHRACAGLPRSFESAPSSSLCA